MSRYSHFAGSAATVPVTAGQVVTRIRAHSSAGGTLIITPAGAAALPTIVIPAGAMWLALDFDPQLYELVDGTTLAFAGTDAYYVATQTVGGAL